MDLQPGDDSGGGASNAGEMGEVDAESTRTMKLGEQSPAQKDGLEDNSIRG